MSDDITALRKQLTESREAKNKAMDLLEKERQQSLALKNKVRGGFYLMNRRAEKNLRELQENCPAGALVFSVLRESMGIGNSAVTISNKVICKMVNRSRATVTRAINYLAKKKYIQILKVGSTNCYVVNEQVCFAGSVGQRKAVFSATVVAHEVEQPKELKEDLNKPLNLKKVPLVYDGERPYLNTNEELPPPDQKDLDLN